MWWPSLAKGVYKNFAILSWIFVILMIGSTIATGYGFYNYVKYGNCNGPDSSAFCVFNAFSEQSIQNDSCSSNITAVFGELKSYKSAENLSVGG